MELIERIPVINAHYIKSLTFSKFKQLQLYKSSSKNDDERLVQYKGLQRFCDAIIKTKGEVKRIYSYTEITPNEVGGRLYCGNSIQGIPSKLRGFFVRDITTDLDMKNAHPCFLYYLTKKHKKECPNLECPNLAYYIENRDEVLQRMGPDMKTEVLKCINTDKPNRRIKDKFFKDLENECGAIQRQITSLPCYKHIVDSVPSSREYNWLGSAINRILCVYENLVLQEVIHVLNANRIEAMALMFDGVLIYGNHYDDTELLAEIEKAVNTKFEGLNMKFAYKRHSDELVLPSDFVPEQKEPDGVYNDAQAAEAVYELYPHWVCCNDVLYVFNDETGMWESSPITYRKIIGRFSDKLHLLVVDKSGATTQSPKSYGNTLVLMDRVHTLIREHCVNNNWLAEKQNTSLGKILFKNGYYDFHKELFYDKATYGFNPDIVFMGQIHHDYESFDTDYMEDIKQRLFIDPLGKELGEFLILNLARGLAGDCMKRILFGLGGTNGGKSVLTMALERACGDYYGTFNAANLCVKNNVNDEAQNLRWCMLLRFKRIICSSELKSDVNVDGNSMKKASSGGDSLVARGHCANEQSFMTHFLAFVLANDIKKITPYDDAVNGRLQVFSYNKTFVDNPSNEFELKADPNLKQEIQTIAFQKALIGLFIEAYKDKSKFEIIPAEALYCKKEWISTDTNPVDTFKMDFEFTNNPEDFVKSSDIEHWLTQLKLGISMTKFTAELKKYATIHKHDIHNDRKKIGGKLYMCWFGIKQIVETAEDNDGYAESK
jgi:hypothetical protein